MENRQKFNDSLQSCITKIGQKANARSYELSPQNKQELNNAYNSSWIVRKYINKTIGDMTKLGRELYFNEKFSEADKAKFNKAEVEFSIKGVIQDALYNLLLHGQTLILAITDTAEKNYNMPLGQNEQLRRFIVLNKDEFSEIEPKNKFDEISHYRINKLVVHASRCVKLAQGIKSYGLKKRDSNSDIYAALGVAKMFDTITLSVADLIEECKVDIYKVEDYNTQISSGNDELILERLRLIQTGKSYTNAVMMDIKDDWTQKETNLNGLADLWAKASIVVAGALNRPLNIIFGESANGFNSGEEDNRAYYETINELQNTYLRHFYEFSDKFILNYIGKSEAVEFDFISIDSVNEVERANILNTKAVAFSTLIDKGVINEAIALKELRDEGLIKNISEEDVSEAELLSKELEYKQGEYDE
ncbi:DUF1073 domain-containing protein [Campylobacter sp. faydin G-105]|nr:anti-CBASS Acb1 family protein [Campylobacter anatolicus]MBR8461487.1 DUF1073 domain-containing protein [Campylobacter anatolicus]